MMAFEGGLLTHEEWNLKTNLAMYMYSRLISHAEWWVREGRDSNWWKPVKNVEKLVLKVTTTFAAVYVVGLSK